LAIKYRHRVLGFLTLLAVITYLDRVAISIAGPRIQESLQLRPESWGWVVGIFQFSYCVFEIPSGHWGDRFGPRRMLTRIVLSWSAFTALTGLATSLPYLLFIRFCFGIGEAGAFPNMSICLSRWFPVVERARAMGYILMASQLGSAMAPFLIVPLQIRYGWRVAFFVLGAIGVLWCIPWYRWYRDRPTEMPAVPAEELEEIGETPPPEHRPLPWRAAIRSGNLGAIMLVAFCFFFGFYFFLSWLHTFLVKGRGFTEGELLLSTIPPVMGALGNIAGGYSSDLMVRRFGLKWGRRALGMGALSLASLFMLLAIVSRGKLTTLILLGLVYAAITFQQTVINTVVIDVGGKHVGAAWGALNTAAQAGGFAFSVTFGYLVTYFGTYNLALVPVAAMFALGAVGWLWIDATRPIVDEA